MTLVQVSKSGTPERAVSRWASPWTALEGIHSELSRFFDDTLGIAPMGRPAGYSFVPAVDVCENANEIVVKADLPGLTKEDISIAVQGGILTISGERRSETKDHDEHWTYCERTRGTFSRSLQLPEAVDTERVKASFKDGVLEVLVPKSEKAKPRQIKVEG